MIDKLPDDITLCELECIVMPNRDVIVLGKIIGQFCDLKKYLSIKDIQETKGENNG